MKIEKKINSLSRFGKKILKIIESEDEIIHQAWEQNPWFIPTFTHKALYGISYLLDENKLKEWISNYDLNSYFKKSIGIIMAGNIPLVGFHDLISVLLSNNRAVIKLSHNDEILIPYLINILSSIDPEITKDISFADSLTEVDAVIATGSDNTARYFKYAFKNIPYIIRKNRTSCCIIDGKENDQDLNFLCDDIFSYFGLGCRNVSKIYIPENYNIESLYPHFKKYSWILEYPKYNNNYRYSLSKYALENKSFINADYFILMDNKDLVSPIASVYYERYTDLSELESILMRNISRIQCIVTRGGWFPGSIPFGKAQQPEPWDYADNVDTMSFLTSL